MTSRGPARGWGALERALGVRFADRTLLRQACIHPSFLNEQSDPGLVSYDRLEYLGDAFLGWVVASELYARHPGYDEGELTRARAALVRGTTLAEIAERLGLGAYLALGQGEETGGGRTRPRNLAAALEAVLGAVLVDRGAGRARALVLRWLGDRIDAVGPHGAARDAKSALQEAVQRRGLPLPVYEVARVAGPPHARSFSVLVYVNGRPAGEGRGRRKAQAEQAAAHAALADLGPPGPPRARADGSL